MILEQGPATFIGESGSLQYRFRQGTSDRKHFLVIFSGFRPKGSLDFGGAAINAIRHNVLWIYDEFGVEGENAYYLLEKGTYGPRDTVLEFLEKIRVAYALDWENFSFSGFSKGGSAAIYFGLTLNVGAIIATVPQFYIGSYVKKNWEAPFNFMRAGTDSEQEIQQINSIMPKLLESSTTADTHLYIFTSPADEQFIEEIQPHLGHLRNLQHFNLITTTTPLIAQHDQVTAYNVPEIFALFQLTASGLYPELGETSVEQKTSEEIAKLQRQKREGLAVLEGITVSTNGRFDLDMVTLIRGVAQPDCSSMSREIRLLNDKNGLQATLSLGKKIDTTISRRYIQDTFIDYRAARATSIREAGYAIDDLPEGKSRLQVAMRGKSGSSDVPAPVTSARAITRVMATNNSFFRVIADTQGTSLEKVSIKDVAPSATNFLKVNHLSIEDNNRLRLRGWCAPLGTTIQEWGDISYYAHLESEDASYSFPLGMLDRSQEAESLGLPASLRKAYFCDLKNEGVDLSQVLEGHYTLSVLALNKDILTKSQPLGHIDISVAATQPAVAVLGSCIVRDIFNSKFIPDWKNRNQLSAAAHQSALVSLTSKPYNGPEITAADLDKHSKQCVDEDLSKSVMESIASNPPAWIFIDLFSDARFGVREVEGTYITDNAWKIGASSDYQKIKEYPVISMHKNKERYLEIFRESARDLRRWLHETGGNTRIGLVKVRATEQIRDGLGNVEVKSGPMKVLNDAFELLEQVFMEEIPEATLIDLTEYTTWANRNHPWSAYVVHYEQAFYDAEDSAFRQLLGTQRTAVIREL